LINNERYKYWNVLVNDAAGSRRKLKADLHLAKKNGRIAV
jgi:hypothetical protein